MKWIIDSDRPIYKQLVEQIELRIISGIYAPGEKLESVREMAMDAGVNPNTMQKALAELERMGLVFAQRTSGRFITEDMKVIEEAKKGLAVQEISAFLEKMKKLGMGRNEILELMEKIEEGEKEDDHIKH
ncbi:GntR family transcriptional regulator [Acetobacterium wieringae]|jgi:DNA-binding transcriptional regulator YhcF (GntR family)|uniref:GntR family transcriptional regulator n=1 Tax=Acetobacterium wieringae TaxID=52694 RepID=A0A1F2PH04_9FIRM|nr:MULTISPECIES: GntR family transcriptional regulator [Acetobacterium]MEA4804487.1 GntR family transcriptional regulator [Acetobacterium wieringae]OFV70583.1 HTH-type transcriptional repressor YtrA [Acetobacterium wieringae]OXS24638.1 MAG: GntR family transcriptional regulator [Acetobacterium sp. MES1]TYC88247.1 GntR family transcriptional regulator [Acetobacterium wieringae]URN83141.1 GntR family transcriptional regulator [Acetobacterium wieringae]